MTVPHPPKRGRYQFADKSIQGGQRPKGEAARLFKEMSITDYACHEDYRGSLRSSSKWVPNNPSSNGVSQLPCRVRYSAPWSPPPHRRGRISPGLTGSSRSVWTFL